jgi:plasmid stabilization system protein ParE
MKQYKICIIPAAYNDLQQARNWYRTQNPELPRRFNQQLKITMERLRSRPAVYGVRYKDVRIANIAVFPYAVHYIIEPGTVIVLAVHHTAIDPAKWTQRR